MRKRVETHVSLRCPLSLVFHKITFKIFNKQLYLHHNISYTVNDKYSFFSMSLEEIEELSKVHMPMRSVTKSANISQLQVNGPRYTKISSHTGDTWLNEIRVNRKTPWSLVIHITEAS